ncbi:MAG: tatC, partial [Deltaproteobacteria bacterium]|nr:tatC [Deltaproteobacteria bacterium]
AFWSTLGLLAGMSFAYFVAIPSLMNFFLSFGRTVVVPMPSMKESLSLVLRLLLIFGVMFELPLAMFLAGRGGILSAAFLRKWRKGALLGALVLAAVLTPPDAVSQILISVPLYALFEVGILLCALGERRRNAASAVSPS